MGLFDNDEIFVPLHTRPDEIFESVPEKVKGKDDDDINESAGDFADMQARNEAMSIALTWVDEGDYTWDALDALAMGLADMDGDEDIGEDEEEFYNELLSEVAGAMIALGASAENVLDFIDGEDDEAGEKLGAFLSTKMDDVSAEDEDIITGYAEGADGIFEATKKVVRGGKIVLKKKRTRKVRLSAGQRQALKKARRKAFTGAAMRKRKKSMKIRKKRGM